MASIESIQRELDAARGAETAAREAAQASTETLRHLQSAPQPPQPPQPPLTLQPPQPPQQPPQPSQPPQPPTRRRPASVHGPAVDQGHALLAAHRLRPWTTAGNGNCFFLAYGAGYELSAAEVAAEATQETHNFVLQKRGDAIALLSGTADIGGVAAADVREANGLPRDAAEAATALAWLEPSGAWANGPGSHFAAVMGATALRGREVLTFEWCGADALRSPARLYGERGADGHAVLNTAGELLAWRTITWQEAEERLRYPSLCVLTRPINISSHESSW